MGAAEAAAEAPAEAPAAGESKAEPLIEERTPSPKSWLGHLYMPVYKRAAKWGYSDKTASQRNGKEFWGHDSEPKLKVYQIKCFEERRGWDSNPRCPCRHASFQD